MDQNELPVSLIKAAVKMMPKKALMGALGVMMRRMERRHPALFDNLARMDSGTLRVEPEDLPYKFDLTVGPPGAELALADEDITPDASVGGKLEILLQMLEGRVDGDALFFERGITMTGDTSFIVALRNTLEREEIRLIDDVMSFAGPLVAPATKAVEIIEGVARRIKERYGA